MKNPRQAALSRRPLDQPLCTTAVRGANQLKIFCQWLFFVTFYLTFWLFFRLFWLLFGLFLTFLLTFWLFIWLFDFLFDFLTFYLTFWLLFCQSASDFFEWFAPRVFLLEKIRRPCSDLLNSKPCLSQVFLLFFLVNIQSLRFFDWYHS